MRKTLMIIGGGIMQVPAIKIAKGMGLGVIVTDYNPNAPGLPLADIPVIMSTKDIEGSVRAAKDLAGKGRIDGVMTVGTDASMTVAAVANALGLPGIKFESAQAATNKIKMRERFAEHGVPSPRFRGVWTFQEAHAASQEIGFPLVVKPADNMGARGVSKVSDGDDLFRAFRHAKLYSPSGEIVVEEYMEGEELSIDALVFDGQVFFAGIADRIIRFPPYFVEIGHTLPSAQPKEAIEDAKEVMRRGIKALGIDLGAAKGDIKITKSGAKIVELAARLSGGFMSAYTLPQATGIPVIKGAIEIALGERPTDLLQKWNRVSVERAIIPEPGRVVRITGVEEAKRIPGVVEIFIHVQPEDILEMPTSNLGKAGNVIAVADTREEAEAIASAAMKTIKIEIGPPRSLSARDIRVKAQERFKTVCRACKICDAKECTAELPGMGAAGSGATFRANIEALAQYKLNLRAIHDVKFADTSFNFLGYRLDTPILAAPLTGGITNINGALTEERFVRAVVDGCRAAGSLGMVGEAIEGDKYKIGLKAIAQGGCWGIPIFKPRRDQKEILKRIEEAEQVSVAVGVDIASASQGRDQNGWETSPKTLEELRELMESTSLPFIVKGIMTVEDAELAVEAGAEAIVVSNHGGRIMDYMPGTAEVLPAISSAVGERTIVLVDGGIRSGVDVLKCLALGAKGVLVGRPIAIFAVGGGEEGVAFLIRQYTEELRRAMILTKCRSLKDIDRSVIYNKGGLHTPLTLTGISEGERLLSIVSGM
ncbi:MAG: alpha-hydroxy-acid oxidizing protein [bacterium]